MSSFGENFKREREARGISLQEISEHTKIGVRQLKAIENGQLDQLPGGIFNKSFVRQYARFLGLDEDQAITEYLQAIGAAPDAPSTPLNAPSEADSSPSAVGYPRLILSAVCLGIAVAAILYAIHQFTERHVSPGSPAVAIPAEPAGASRETPSLPTNPPTPNNPADAIPASPPSQLSGPPPIPSEESPFTPAAPATGAEEPRASRAGNSSQVQQSAPLAAGVAEKPRGPAGPAEAAGGLVLQIEARKEVWLSITADGQKQWQGTLPADKTRRVQARETVQLTVGDAGAVALTLNGKTLPPVGRPGEVKNLNISAKELAEPAP